jgi:anti-sigma factor RsiW
MQSKPIIDADLYVDNEYSKEDTARIREKIESTPELAAQIERLDAVNQQLRASAKSVRAPESLHDSLSDLLDVPVDDARFEKFSSTKRNALIGGGAFLAAAIAGVASLRLHQEFSADAKANLVTQTFFKDFETYLVKDRTLDVQENDLVKIAQWYEPRLPFRLPPISSSGAGASLIGGRLCWLLERRLASLSFDTPKGPVVLYISQANDLELPSGGKSESFGDEVTWHRSRSNTSLIWTIDDLLMAMVSTQEISGLKRIARSIIS